MFGLGRCDRCGSWGKVNKLDDRKLCKDCAWMWEHHEAPIINCRFREKVEKEDNFWASPAKVYYKDGDEWKSIATLGTFVDHIEPTNPPDCGNSPNLFEGGSSGGGGAESSYESSSDCSCDSSSCDSSSF